jgi:hypothetical protein
MGTLLSLSSPATTVCWYVAVACTFAFGTLFLVSWLSEEFATSEKWKKRRKLLITLAIVGVAGEQIGTIAEFAFSEHLQTLSNQDILAAKQELNRLAPRAWLINEGAKNIDAKLRPFSGQRVAILECQLYDKIEVGWTAIGLAQHFDESGWLNAWGESILVPDTADSVSSGQSKLYNKASFPSSDSGRCSQGVFIEIGPRASPRARNAAKVLESALDAERVAAVNIGHLNWPVPSFLPSTDDLIIVSVGIRGI